MDVVDPEAVASKNVEEDLNRIVRKILQRVDMGSQADNESMYEVMSKFQEESR